MARTRSTLLLLNSGVRLAYGVGALLAPALMAKARFVPDTEDQPPARLFVRGFGAHQVAVALLGLESTRRRHLERPALVAAVAIDLVDMLSAAVEAAARDELHPDTVGGFLFSATGAATAAAALLADD
jgi:hypothetical protein